jgi:hypothetical protein
MKNKKNNVTLVKPSTKHVQPDEKVALKNVEPGKTLKPETSKPDLTAKLGSDAKNTKPVKPLLTE